MPAHRSPGPAKTRTPERRSVGYREAWAEVPPRAWAMIALRLGLMLAGILVLFLGGAGASMRIGFALVAVAFALILLPDPGTWRSRLRSLPERVRNWWRHP